MKHERQMLRRVCALLARYCKKFASKSSAQPKTMGSQIAYSVCAFFGGFNKITGRKRGRAKELT